MISKELLDILCCPQCRSALREDRERQELICTKCSASYPIRDGIPILLPEPPQAKA